MMYSGDECYSDEITSGQFEVEAMTNEGSYKVVSEPASYLSTETAQFFDDLAEAMEYLEEMALPMTALYVRESDSMGQWWRGIND